MFLQHRCYDIVCGTFSSSSLLLDLSVLLHLSVVVVRVAGVGVVVGAAVDAIVVPVVVAIIVVAGCVGMSILL
jgi:hypothetical protein